MKRVLLIALCVILVLSLITLISAPNNNSNQNCTDSDGGKNYFVKGITTSNETLTVDDQVFIPGTHEDKCVGNELEEYFCVGGGSRPIVYTCPNGCEDGACANETDEEDDDCEWQCTKWTECINETKTRICTNANNCTEEKPKESKECDTENEDEQKVCCLRIITKGNESYQKYNYIEKDDCLEFAKEIKKEGITKKSEVVNNSFCAERKINKTEIKEQVRERQRIKFETKTGVECPDDCICTGVTMKCILEDGTREMKVYAGNSGNLIIQIKDTNVSTTITLYKDENGTLYTIKDGREKKIKYLPDQVKEKVKEKIKQRTCECENITLNEDGYYEVQTKKKSRLFWLIPVREKVRAQVESETGDVKIRNPWWGFLSRDKKEE